MVRRCEECGADNGDEAERCVACGAALSPEVVPEVEIEVYDLGDGAAGAPSFVEEVLAATRERVKKEEPEPPADLAVDEVLQQELRTGYETRRRRADSKLRRPRNVVIIAAAAAALAVFLFYGVRWAVTSLPKYEYAEPAYVGSTNLALEMAAELESTSVDVSPAAGEPAAVLAIAGDGGKVFLDGNYVADVPVARVRVPAGRRHVIVKQGNEITLDETIDFKRGERYVLEPTGAAALAAPE